MEAHPQPADPLHHRRQAPADGRQFRGEDIRLLAAHALGGGPTEPQHKGRDARLGHQLLHDLPHRHLAVQHLIVRADDLDLHIPDGHKVPDIAVPAALHGPAPLPGDLGATLLGQGGIQFPALGLVDHREADVAHPLPVGPHGGVDFPQQLRQKGHPPQHGYAVGAAALRIVGGEEQQVLAGEGLGLEIIGADREVQGILPLPDGNVLHPAAEHCGDVPPVRCQDDLPDPLAEGEHRV